MENNFSLKTKYANFTLDVEFSINTGEFISIIGPSGCGKSTTLQLITGLLENDESKVVLMGKDITNTEVHKREIAMVFQDYALFPHMNVYNNIAYPLKIKNVDKQQIKNEVEELLELVNLSGYEKRKIEELSGGEKQRIAIARALASKPKLLLLDEPLSALDAKLRTHIRSEIKEIHKKTGITTIYVTHDQSEALGLSDKIIVLNNGRIEQYSNSEDIYNNPANLFVASFMGESNIIEYSKIKEELKNFDCEYILFRPEDVLINTNEESLVLENAQLKSYEFQGSFYKHTYCYKNIEINIQSSIKLQDIQTLKIPLNKIKRY